MSSIREVKDLSWGCSSSNSFSQTMPSTSFHCWSTQLLSKNGSVLIMTRRYKGYNSHHYIYNWNTLEKVFIWIQSQTFLLRKDKLWTTKLYLEPKRYFYILWQSLLIILRHFNYLPFICEAQVFIYYRGLCL